jgi:hypothetical protein
MKTPKQTPIEYLVEQLLPKSPSVWQFHHIEQAKKMFEEQIKNAHKSGIEFLAGTQISDTEYSEKYFEETFEK